MSESFPLHPDAAARLDMLSDLHIQTADDDDDDEAPEWTLSQRGSTHGDNSPQGAPQRPR